jgi:small subunit ribosomal protein S6
MPQRAAYDLFVLIDPGVEDDRREQILQAVKSQIDSGDGTLKGDADWGARRLAYEIDHRQDAHYHLFQLEAAPELLATLNRNLAIEDGVLRHRLIRLPKGTPERTPRPPAPRPARAEEQGGDGGPPRGPAPSSGGEAAPVQGEEPAATGGGEAPAAAEAAAPEEAAAPQEVAAPDGAAPAEGAGDETEA